VKEIKGLDQGSHDWVLWRHDHIGSSDASIVLDMNPWKNPIQLWNEKVAELDNKPQNDAMRLGSLFEPKIRQWYSEQTGLEFSPIVCEHDSISYLGASLDGISIDRKHAIEIKCGASAYRMALDGEIPLYYQCQIQHIYYVCGVDTLTYIAADPNEKGETIVIPVEPDQYFFDMMFREYPPFWHCVENFISPNVAQRKYKVCND